MSFLTAAAEGPNGYLIKKPSALPLSGLQKKAIWARTKMYNDESRWPEYMLEHESTSGEQDILFEIEHCGCLTTSSGTNPVENFYDIFNWEGGTTDTPWYGGCGYDPTPAIVARRQENKILSDLEKLGLIDAAVKAKEAEKAKQAERPVNVKPLYQDWPTVFREGWYNPSPGVYKLRSY